MLESGYLMTILCFTASWYSALYTDISLKKKCIDFIIFLMFETTAINGVMGERGFPVNEGLGQSWWLVSVQTF